MKRTQLVPRPPDPVEQANRNLLSHGLHPEKVRRLTNPLKEIARETKGQGRTTKDR